MRLVRLEVWNWRGLDHAVLRELAPDLNLVVGPNESGKSRLFEALRYALFERYKGESEEKKKLRTWGGGESPTVEVDFESGGRAWKVHKRFLKGATAKLEGPGGSWTDDDAEAQLRAIWGTQEIKGRKEMDQSLGLWPLLWVQQGRAGSAPHSDLNDTTRARLNDALAVQVNEVVTGQKGQRILALAEEERARYWTATWKERGEATVARERREAARAAYDRAVAKRDQARAAADELERLEAALAEGDTKLQGARARMDQTRTRVVEARDRAGALDRHELEAKTLNADRELWKRRGQERAEVEADVGAIVRDLSEREAEIAKLDAMNEPLVLERAASLERVQRAEQREASAKRNHRRALGRERRAELTKRAEALRQSLREAEAHRARVRTLGEELRTLRAGPGEMKELRRAKESHTRASAALSAAAARVTMRAEKAIMVDGTALAAGETREWQLDEATSIRVDGLLDLHVSPAGVELHGLRDRERDARQILEAMLGTLGAASVPEAEDQHHRRIALDAEAKHEESLLARLGAGKGERLEVTLETVEAEIATLSTTSTADGPDDETISAEVAASEVPLAEEALRASRVERDVLEREVVRIAAERQTAQTRLEDARTRHVSVVSRLAALPPHDQITAAASAAEATWLKTEALVDALRTELRRRGDLDADTDREREEKAFAQLEALQRANKDRSIELQTSVRHFGAEAIHDEVLQAESELDQASRDLERVLRRAAAARALVLALTAAQREVQEQLVAPVREKVEPYLHGLLPGASLDVGEGYAVNGLRVGDHAEEFEALSGGAKEQVSLLVRLGLAEVLGQDESLPIVLDDCLVNTDPERQEDMLRILYRASKKQQIVLFSCHEVAFDRLGATRRYDLPARRAR